MEFGLFPTDLRHMAKKIVIEGSKNETAPAKPTTKLKATMNGKASPAKAAEGDAPVFDYIASLPQPQRGIAERIDVLAAKTLPGLRRSVKWGMAYDGVDGGWCFASRAFVGPVKLMGHTRNGPEAGTAGDAGRNGQGHTRR